VFAPSRARVVRSFGWMLISISLIPAAIGWLVPDLVLARMSSDWAQALAVGLRVGGSRLIGLFVGLLCAGVILVVLGALGPRLGSVLTPARTPGERTRPGAPIPPAGRGQQAAGTPRAGQYFPEELAVTRPMAVHHDDPRYATPPSGYPQSYPESYPQSQSYPQSYPESYPPSQQPAAFPGGQDPDYGPYGEQPPDHDPYGPRADGRDRRR